MLGPSVSVVWRNGVAIILAVVFMAAWTGCGKDESAAPGGRVPSGDTASRKGSASTASGRAPKRLNGGDGGGQPQEGASGTAQGTPTAPPTGTTSAGVASHDPNAPIPQQVPINLGESGARAHEQSALLALGELKELLAAKDFAKAKAFADAVVKDYADTMVAREFPPLQQQANGGAIARSQESVTTAAAPDNVKVQRHADFLRARDAGISAMDKKDVATATACFQQALQLEDDADVRDLLAQANNLGGKPRVCVAKLDVIGDVGLNDAGKAVSELMLSRFDPKRFQLVERSRVEAALGEQGLTLAQICDNSKVLRVKKIGAIRYLVTGSVVRVGHLSVSARLVDVVTGDIVQTAEIAADDANGLESGLSDLVAMLQMSDEEKSNFLAFKQKQNDSIVGVDPTGRATAATQEQAAIAAERERIAQTQAAAFAQMQHERDAIGVVADIYALLARGEVFGAQRTARWALQNFGDTQTAPELTTLSKSIDSKCQEAAVQQQNAAQWQQIQAQQAARHQRSVQFRDQGFAALVANDLLSAMAFLQNALGEENDPGVRDLLDQINRRMQRPGIAVADFDVRGEIGLPRREAGRSLAAYLLHSFDRPDRAFRLVERGEFEGLLAQVGLRMSDVQADPMQPRMRALRGAVRFIVVGVARTGPLTVSATMLDLETGRRVQTAEFVALNDRAIARALTDMAIILQMSDEQKGDYLNQLAFAEWMSKGDAAVAAGRWDDAMDAYRRAYRIRNAAEALDRMTDVARRLEAYRAVRRDHDLALAAGNQAVRGGDWNRAMECYRQALAILNTRAARTAYDEAVRKVIESAEAQRRWYDRVMREAEAFTRNDEWEKALDAYQQAVQIDPAPDARRGVGEAQRHLAERRNAIHREYLAAMDDARGHIAKGDWARALEAFTRAAAIEYTREALNGIATARQKLAEYQHDKRIYDDAMRDAEASARSGEWRKALEAYSRAQSVMNTADARAGVASAKAHLAEMQQRDQKKLYDAAFGGAEAHARSGQWQDALESYRAAYNIDKTKEALAGITTATKMLNDTAYNKKQYGTAINQALAATRAGNWTKAFAAYQQAAAIEGTPEAKAGIATAQQKLQALAASDKSKEYQRLENEGDAAAKRGQWQQALDLYTKAAAINNTTEVQADIASAKKAIADAGAAADRNREHTQLMSQADAAAKAGDWQKALAAYEKAAVIDNTAETRTAVAYARKKIADAATASTAAAEKDKEFNRLNTQADAAVKGGDWQKALDLYTKAAALSNTTEIQAAIANARRKLADAAAASANAAEKNKQFTRLNTEGDAAARTGDWQKALDLYTKAAAISNTSEVQADIANVRKKLADAATAAAAANEKKNEFARLNTGADAAAKVGEWQKALDLYIKAAAINNTPEVQADIANVRKKLADDAAASKKNEFTQFKAQADAAAKVGDWQKAIDLYTKAAAISNTAEVQGDIANAKKKLADADAAAAAANERKTEFTRLNNQADAAARARDWQKALDLYTKAAAISNTADVQVDIANAKSKLADANAAAEKKKQYTAAMADGDAAFKAGEWQKALDAYEKAAGIDNAREVQADIARTRKKLADATGTPGRKVDYSSLMADGNSAAKSGDWQKAMDLYTRAQSIKDTPEVRAAVANAKKKVGR